MANERKKSLSRYDLEFLARTCAAREAVGMTQAQLGEKLGRLTQDHYKQYEIRTPLPHYLIPAFLEATKVSYDYLFTGRAEGPAWRTRYQELLERRNKKKVAKKAA
jgi:transcriptional regulator with XRE-family HTH domain